jgi:peptidoglycan/xylan/chitin deacetylase (PgdA/CDA1 family)
MKRPNSLFILLTSASLFAAPTFASPACGPEALGTARTISIGEDVPPLGLQSYPRTLALHDHEIVLTFDDGPAPLTSAILDALAQQCVRATFFLIGQNAQAMPRLVKREIAEGHTVAHHSFSHPERTLRLTPYGSALEDIDRGMAAVDTAGFGQAAGKAHTPFFRFPGFADTPELLAALKQRGITVFGTDVWASDWKPMSPEAELTLVMSRIEKAGKGIVLFHDNKAQTAAMLPDFLRALKARGFSIVHIEPGAGPTPVEDAGPDWKSTTEPIIEKILGAKARGAHDVKSEAPSKGM